MQQSIKSLNLPSPIAAYFAADKVGGEAVSQCFTENAIVLDEGHSYQGRAEIRAWKSGASAKYQYTTEPFACEEKDGKHVVTSHVAGNFPGSPINIRYLFKLDASRIASLEIIAP